MTAGMECPACKGSRPEAFYANLTRCGICTHVWANLSLDWDSLRAIYQPGYFLGEEYSNYLVDRRVIQKNFSRRLETLRPFLTPAHRRLFEVGCAYGFFLDLARGSFESVQGIDISADAASYAEREFGLSTHCGDLLEFDFTGAGFDVACMWDTIEHLAEPRLYLERLASQMSPGALLALTTGDIGSLTAQIQKERWRLIHPPSHLQYFTQGSLAGMLQACGFRLKHLEYCGFSRGIRSMVHSLVALRWGHPRAAERLGRLVPARMDLYLNLYDIMYVIAERR